jgi:hypothetical protein
MARTEAWQDDAWSFYDTNGELRFAVGWIANGVSQLNLVAARRPELLGDEPAPVNGDSEIEADARTFVAEIAGGPDGQTEMLARLATLLTVPGVGWLLIESDSAKSDPKDWKWRALSSDEIRSERGDYEIEDVSSTDAGTDGFRPIAEQHVLVKVWRSHARKSSQPDSSCRAALRPLRQLALLDDHIEATATSRLAGAGLLVLPNEIEFSPVAKTNADGEPDGVTTDDFVQTMIESFAPAIVDRGAASAFVPLTIKVPGEYVDKVKHLTFWTEFSDTVLALGERAIKRLALALDLPPEVVTGTGGANHWSAWRVQEEAITLHIKPLANIICHALTQCYLAPALLSVGHAADEVAQFLVSIDPTNLTVRPDLSDDTIAAWDRMEVSSATLRREIGLSESDKPDEAEFRRRLILRAIDRSPQLATSLLSEFGIDIEPVANEQQYPIEPTETVPQRQIGGPPDTPPARAASVTADRRLSEPALLAACDGLIHRALERAGARLRNHAGRVAGGAGNVECDDIAELHTQIDATTFSNVHELLEGAWTRVPVVADRYGIPVDVLLSAVDSYTRGLLVNGQAHSIERLSSALPFAVPAGG